MSRGLTFAAAVAASAVLITACGGNGSGPAGSGSSSSSSASSSSSSSSSMSGSGTDVVTFKNDVLRTGQNLTEWSLTPANVKSATFGLLRNLMVDGAVDAQPLYLSKLSVAGTAHNVVFVATENDSVYAFDAETGAKVWQVSLLGSSETASDDHGCDQISPSIGVTSTPVIDRTAGANGTIFVVSMTKDGSGNYHQRLHALDVTNGAERTGSPVDVSATFGGTTFAPGTYAERAALLLVNGTLYTSWTSHCDNGSYGGWVIAFDEATLARTGALNVAAGASGSGFASQGPAIWMAGDGAAADASGNVYVLTGNGKFDTTLTNGFPSSGDYGNSFVKISKSGSGLGVSDYFTMSNEVTESTNDQDLGSGGVMLLPDLTDSTGTVRHLVIGAGKDESIYVVDRDAMGKFDPAQNHIWQQIDGALGGAVFSSPAYFNGTVYYGPAGAQMLAFAMSQAKLATGPSSSTSTAFGYPGTSPVVSANGTTSAIVWAYENGSGGAAVLHAYDATNLATELYNSNQAAGGRDHFGSGNKFIVPMVADGKVFAATTNSVAVFGLLP